MTGSRQGTKVELKNELFLIGFALAFLQGLESTILRLVFAV